MSNYRVFLSLSFFLLSISFYSYGQRNSLILQKPKPTTSTIDPVPDDADIESANVQKVIEELFDAMRISSGANVSHLFENGATLSSVATSQLGNTQVQSSNIQGFIDALRKPRRDQWDERIWSYDIKIDGALANAWTPYTFYVNDQISHCGVNNFELVKKSGVWKINRIIDTRRKMDCIKDPIESINTFMDNWHKAAAVGDDVTFFNSMTEDGVYIGTDASERWDREEMRKWAKPYFDKGSAWSFTAKNRNVSISEDGQMAWADELLDTWMGDCRSSVVLVKQDDDWKIKYYHLSIAVPNNAVDGYLRLIGKQRR